VGDGARRATVQNFEGGMRAREIIETALFAVISEATRINYIQIGNTQANVDKIVALLATIPEELNLELNVVIQNHVNEEA
jgi:hypothetical protein